MMRLRVHHLLCSALYAGKGYSEAFCENMQRASAWLWTPPAAPEEAGKEPPAAPEGAGKEPDSAPHEEEKRDVWLTVSPDDICRACPNLGEYGCKLDDDHVVSKDAALAEALGLKTECAYPAEELLQTVGCRLTAEIFENSCRNCEWYEQGLCRYEWLAERYRRILT